MGGAWDRPDLEPLDADTCVWCRRPGGGEHGVRAIMDVLEAAGLAGVFFVDSAIAAIDSPAALREVCREIIERGHDVQLHLHPGARAYARVRAAGPVAGKPPGTADNLHAYDEDEQHALLVEARDVLAEAAGRTPVAFRAGNYGVNDASLRALARAGFAVDLSYNLAYLGGQCRLSGHHNAPYRAEGLVEIPVTQLIGNRTPGRGYRPLEISCLTADEAGRALRILNAAGQRVATLMFHSFGLLKHRTGRWERAREDRVVRRRLERVCEWLAENADAFEVSRLADAVARPVWLDEIADGPEAWPKTTWALLVGRYFGQLAGRL